MISRYRALALRDGLLILITKEDRQRRKATEFKFQTALFSFETGEQISIGASPCSNEFTHYPDNSYQSDRFWFASRPAATRHLIMPSPVITFHKPTSTRTYRN